MTPTTKAALDAAEKAINRVKGLLTQDEYDALIAPAMRLIAEARKAEETRYFLSNDGSGHWYIVLVSRQEEWYQWRNLDEDDEASWEAPSFASRINGSPELVHFISPEVK